MVNGFSYQARVFVKIDWKSLPMTNTLAYYEKIGPRLETRKKSYENVTIKMIKRVLWQGLQ
jgi:hypothetical protein